MTVEDGVTETISKQSNVGVGEAIEAVELTVDGALERVKDIFEAIVGDCVDEALDDDFDEAFDAFNEPPKNSFGGGIFGELIFMRDSALRRRVLGTMIAGGFGGGCLSSENGRCSAGKKDIKL